MNKSEKEEINELCDMLQEIPEHFKEWCKNKMMEAPIYYKRRGEFTDCICGKCGEEYTLYTPKIPEYGTLFDDIPVRNRRTECKECGHSTYFEWKRVTAKKTEVKRFCLYQLLENKDIVIRIFEDYKEIQQGNAEREKLAEIQRIFLSMGQVKKMTYFYYYYTANEGWKMTNRKGYPYIQYVKMEMYPGSVDVILKSNLKYGLQKEIEKNCRYSFSQNEILMAYANNPAIEYYAKMGMEDLVSNLVLNEGIWACVNRKKNTPMAQLRLKNKQNLKLLVEKKGNVHLLEIMQLEEKHKMRWTDEQKQWLAEKMIRNGLKKEINYFLKFMSLQKLINRVEKYTEQQKKNNGYAYIEGIIMTYYDYLKMREELEYDMTNEVFIYPKDLHKKHQEMVKEKNARSDEVYIKSREKKYNRIRTRYEELCKKYQAKTAGYIIRPAMSAEEIILEGRALHHCVGNDEYLEKHARGKTTILFLRKQPNKPYITIEIKGNEIVQWYGKNDKKPDKEIIEELLKSYVKQLKIKETRQKKKEIKEEMRAAV